MTYTGNAYVNLGELARMGARLTEQRLFEGVLILLPTPAGSLPIWITVAEVAAALFPPMPPDGAQEPTC